MVKKKATLLLLHYSKTIPTMIKKTNSLKKCNAIFAMVHVCNLKYTLGSFVHFATLRLWEKAVAKISTHQAKTEHFRDCIPKRNATMK